MQVFLGSFLMKPKSVCTAQSVGSGDSILIMSTEFEPLGPALYFSLG